MPERHIEWWCSTCRRRWYSYDEARQCETDHIVKDAVERTTAAMKAAVENARQGKPRLKAARTALQGATDV